ncbi:TlpA disulfide reductase family protein [Gracilimonas sp.]|uniref:TlpA family protein disulfide reductase n=1 Tax=Gracilimonas sp. TaxID=1974203 RepID=UPI0032ECE99F
MNKDNSTPQKSSAFKKELLQWGVIFLVGAILYGTGYHTEVIGKLQSVVLYTGLFQPDVEESVMPGNNADFNMRLISLDGTPTSFSDFKGKTIFLNFWATWCPPCIAEMPNIQRLYDDIQDDDIVFVMASLDQNPQTAKDFIKRKEFTFPVYSAISKPRVYDTSMVPTTYVISPDGTIVMKHAGMATYNTAEFKAFLRSFSNP